MSVPAKGEVVPLRDFESMQWGGHSEVVTDRIHPENAELCCRAAALLGIDVAGIDLITSDIGKPWNENGGVINEVNHAPFFGAKPERKHLLREFAENLLPEGGRIPLDLVIGGQGAIERGRELQKERCTRQERCFLVADGCTVRPDGSLLATTAKGLYLRARALLLDRNVDSIVLVAENDRLLETGLPVDRISTLDASIAASEPWAQRLCAWANRFKVTEPPERADPTPDAQDADHVPRTWSSDGTPVGARTLVRSPEAAPGASRSRG